MGQAKPPKRVLPVVAITSQFDSAFGWSLERLQAIWGPVWLLGERFEFNQTEFYQASMGHRLQKQLVAFEGTIDPEQLADYKCQSNQLEWQFAAANPGEVERPLNLDPGYVTEAKLVLATVKDRDHRIYLRNGIYAEITLAFHGRQWNPMRWTYPDYLLAENLQFLTRCRDRLREKLHAAAD